MFLCKLLAVVEKTKFCLCVYLISLADKTFILIAILLIIYTQLRLVERRPGSLCYPHSPPRGIFCCIQCESRWLPLLDFWSFSTLVIFVTIIGSHLLSHWLYAPIFYLVCPYSFLFYRLFILSDYRVFLFMPVDLFGLALYNTLSFFLCVHRICTMYTRL